MTTEDIIISGIISVVSCGIYDAIKFSIIKAKKEFKFFNSKFSQILRFVIAYVIPIMSMVSMLVEETEPGFRNIGFFIIIAICFVYNILMEHIITQYKMITELTNISSDKVAKIDSTFTKVYSHIENLKKENNLK